MLQINSICKGPTNPPVVVTPTFTVKIKLFPEIVVTPTVLLLFAGSVGLGYDCSFK